MVPGGRWWQRGAPAPPPRSSTASVSRGCHATVAVSHVAVGSQHMGSAEAPRARWQCLLTALTALTALRRLGRPTDLGSARLTAHQPPNTRHCRQSRQRYLSPPYLSSLFSLSFCQK